MVVSLSAALSRVMGADRAVNLRFGICEQIWRSKADKPSDRFGHRKLTWNSAEVLDVQTGSY